MTTLMVQLKVLIVLVALALAAPAHAHTRSQASASLETQGGSVRLSIAVEAREATRLAMLPGMPGDLGAAIRKHYLDTIQIEADGAPCPLIAQPAAFAALLRLDLHAACPQGWRTLTLRYGAFFEIARGHIAIVHSRIGGQDRGDIVLSKLSETVSFDRTPRTQGERPGEFPAFVWLGLTHILEGIDHLFFVLGLLVAARGFREAALTLTGFTLGHSLTLALSALDVVRVAPHIVEALIPVTILCVALEALRRKGVPDDHALWPVAAMLGLLAAALAFGLPPLFAAAAAALLLGSALSPVQTGWRLPFALAAAFGTIHGLAFAQTLKELTGPGASFLTALLGFNVGVELGQLTFAAAIWSALFFWARRHGPSAAAAKYAIPVLLLFGGAAWLAARLPMS